MSPRQKRKKLVKRFSKRWFIHNSEVARHGIEIVPRSFVKSCYEHGYVKGCQFYPQVF